MQERFQQTSLDIVILGNERWLRGPQIGSALGFAAPDKAIRQIFQRNQPEFDDSTTLVIEMPTAGGRQLVRLYNARGAALIAMKAQTPKGEAFRRWVLDVLEGKADASDDRPIRAGEMTPTVLNRLQIMFLQTAKMRQLVRYRSQGLNRAEIAKLLDVGGSHVSAMVRVAEFLGILAYDEKIERHRASPQYQAFLQGKAEYAARRAALKKAGQAALPAPAADREDA